MLTSPHQQFVSHAFHAACMPLAKAAVPHALLRVYDWLFMSGIQALVGQLRDASDLFSNWTAVWKHWEALPELFDVNARQRHPIQRVGHVVLALQPAD